MTTSPYRPLKNPYPADYTSNALRLFVNGLEQWPEAQVLDVGPVCGKNINFLAQRVRRLYVCDIFLFLDRYRRNGLPLSEVWHQLNYSPETFHGILLWGLFDHLDECEAGRLVKLCYTMVRPGGMLMVMALGGQEIPAAVNSFVILDDFRLYLHPQPHLDLPFHHRQNRDVLGTLAPFSSVKSFIYHNGVREFLLQRN